MQGTLQSYLARHDGELPSQGVERHLDGAATLSSSALHTRELACTASLYDAEEAQDSPGSPSCSYDMLYNHGLVLQELATRDAPGSPEHLAHLSQACAKFEASLQVQPGALNALFNWGVCLNDLAASCKDTAPATARACLVAATRCYAEAIDVQPDNPQVLNNWGLVLQELSEDMKYGGERDVLLRQAIAKFRQAVRARPDYDSGCYNLGRSCYTYACTLQGELAGASASRNVTAPSSPMSVAEAEEAAQSWQAREAEASSMFTHSAQYICLAFVLQQQKAVYRQSLNVVKQLLPLPFLRAGFLSAPVPSTRGTPDEVWRRDWFVLDHASLRSATSSEGSLSGHLVTPQLRPSPADSSQQALVLPIPQLVHATRVDDPSLPEGAALWICCEGDTQGSFLVADDEDAADAWTDAVILLAHIARTRSPHALTAAMAASTMAHHH